MEQQTEQIEAKACGVTVERYRQLVELYRAGKYRFPPPPVYHGNWDESAWIRFVNRNGQWIESTDVPAKQRTP